ncbi:MAG: ribonuclease III [Oscillospiraceae bacterium]|nr:ribonuclease III [Oscillospiraceae bacterium]
MKELQKVIDYNFKDERFLTIALTHSSYANEVKGAVEYNERQEFLGDAVLSIIVSDYLFENFSQLPEGQLTKKRASLVCEKTLSDFAKTIDLGKYMYLGKGEAQTGGANRASILADAFEALIAAIYLDGGIEPAKKFVLGFVIPALEKAPKKTKDYKTELQEVIQQNPEEKLTYVMVGESGPDHDKRFTAEVHLNSNVIGVGEGKSKKEAEQMAAKEALRLMGL